MMYFDDRIFQPTKKVGKQVNFNKEEALINMKSIQLKSIALVASIFLLFFLIFFGQFTDSDSVALFGGKAVRYKIATPSEKNDLTHRYQVDNQKTVTQQNNIKDPEISVGEISKFPDDFEAWAIAYLRSHIEDTDLDYHDYKFLLDFRSYVRTHFTEEWKTKLLAVIDMSFSNIKNDISQFYKDMDRYDTWFEHNKNLLATMEVDEIRAAMRQKRKEIFGGDADLIWLADSKNEDLNDLLSIFNNASHISIEDKAMVFASVWGEMNLKNTAEDHENILISQKKFLNMNSVQMELAQMNASQRADSLSRIRRIMGYSEKKTEEMGRFDFHQNKQWNRGQEYMQKRQTIASNYIGGEREAQLQALRRRYFEQEANIIAAEEASGIFRFERERIYGHR